MVKLSQNELLILKSLQSGRERYGLEIRKAIEESFNQRMNFSSLYPKLELLEAKGFVTSKEDDIERPERANTRRKYFKITGEGGKALNDWENAFNNVSNYQIPGLSTPQGV